MKKTIFLVGLCLPLLFAGAAAAIVNPENQPATATHTTIAEWTKSTTGAWAGVREGATYWYKLDKNAQLWWSIDGKEWAAVKDGMWADKEGKWLKIHDKKLVWTTDGKEWGEVPEWKWEGADGKWYKFDANWALWVNG